MNHCLRIQRAVEIISGHEPLVANEIIHAAPAFQCLLCNHRRCLVTENRHERSDNSNRMLDELSHALEILRDPGDASHPEHIACPMEDYHAAEQAICDDRLENIQLKLPR